MQALTKISRMLFRQLRLTVASLKQETQYSYQLSIALPKSILAIIAFAYVSSYLVELIFANLNYDTLTLRSIVACSLLPLYFRPHWPEQIRRLGYVLTTTIIGILLPFCFGAILLLNASMSPVGSVINSYAITEYVLSLYILVQLLLHTKLVMLVWGLSTSAVLILVAILPNTNIDLVLENLFYILPFFLTVLLISGIINRNIHNHQSDREQAVWNIANAIAHQLRTPLATIRNLASGTESSLPRLVSGYKKAVEHNLVDNPLRKAKLEILYEVMETVSEEVQHSNALIDILITNSKPFELLCITQDPIDISQILHKAVNSFPYNNPIERDLVDLSLENGFQVNGLENMILHVFYNLIGNAVEYSQKRKSGRIRIFCGKEAKWNTVIIWDSGIGIPKNLQHRVFEPFFSRNSPNGTGIGLSFCKSVMEGLGGHIRLESVENEYCQFTLLFPKPMSTQTPSLH